MYSANPACDAIPQKGVKMKNLFKYVVLPVVAVAVLGTIMIVLTIYLLHGH